MNWWKGLKGKVSLGRRLEDCTSFRIGGPAKYFIEPKDSDDLRLLVSLLKEYKIPIFLLGAGSNILVNDQGIEAAVVRLSAPFFKRVSFQDNHLEAGAGCLLAKVISLAKERGLSGLEFLSGIPGTIGGALVMNAGGSEKNIGDLVENVTIMDYNSKIKTLVRDKINFGYRSSSLSKYIILSARIKLLKRSKKEVREKIRSYLDYRRARQNLSSPSAGCIFKNPKGISAGRLIDLCGLKGNRDGDACICRKHANFILNLGNADAASVLRLITLIKRRVKNRFHLDLQPEIKIWR